MRYRRYITVSLLLIIIAIFITAVANEMRSIWLLIIAFAILFAAFGLLFTGLTLRAEYNIMRELRRRRLSKYHSAIFMQVLEKVCIEVKHL